MPIFPLRPYQDKAVNAVNRWIYYRKDNGYLKAAGGAGKSIMIAATAEYAYKELGKKTIILARSEKLLSQNRAKFLPELHNNIGIYCAGIGEKDLSKPITIATIQSIYTQGLNLKADLILIDEVQNLHSNSDSDTQYWKFIRDLGSPQIIGYTATDWRTHSGVLSFGKKIYDISFSELVNLGFLMPPTNKALPAPDLSKVQIIRGEYNEGQLEEIYLEPELLARSLEALQKYTHNRSSVLIFTQSRNHGKILKQAMIDNGMDAVYVDGEMDKKTELSPVLNSFARREFKYLINVALLVEGIDIPVIDCICVFLSTMSKGKFEQILYRGTRLCPEVGKKDFLVLDMGGNFESHGALGSPYKEPNKQEHQNKKGKICPQCESFIALTNKECPDCNYQFPESEIKKISHNDEVDISSNPLDENPIVAYNVQDISYNEHRKMKNGKETRSLRIDFYCPLAKYGKISKWLSPYSESDWARNQVSLFFRNAGDVLGSDPSSYSIDDFMAKFSRLKKPSQIVVDIRGKFPDVKEIIYPDKADIRLIEDKEEWVF